MLKIDKLVKKFGSNLAVANVSFKVKPGEIFSLIGPNGSGKTTIIKLIAGLLQPTSGGILVGGMDVIKDPVGAKAQIGYIPDEPNVWPAMTGEEFLQLTATLYGMNEKVILKKIPQLLSLFNLKGTEKSYFEDYSRGNKQKFTILAALIHQPRLLLIDEPIVGLDPGSAEIAKEEFRRFAFQGGAILLATHTLPVAKEIATKIGILKEGRLVTVGTFMELCSKANLEKEASLEEVYKSLT
jgi:ABC-2 type transport system ATP-binding protein